MQLLKSWELDSLLSSIKMMSIQVFSCKNVCYNDVTPVSETIITVIVGSPDGSAGYEQVRMTSQH